MSPTNLVWKTSFNVDLPLLQKEVAALIERVGFDKSTQQIGLTHTPDCHPHDKYFQSVGSLYDYEQDQFLYQERDFSILNADLKGSHLEWIYQNVPFRVARMRLMRMPPRKCLSIHDDTGPRFHIAIKTNPFSYLFFPDTQQSFQIPTDGALYGMDATKLHTAFNADLKEDRIHLVFSDFDKS
ncbi:hypothetical protein [Bdellovibrio sp. HCB2-146]|uniref:hypothetical protein n=1 Tax=Bdellovibrio sp. HCB2-146 TaxID=3394362 RepID=UPI0039BC8AE8